MSRALAPAALLLSTLWLIPVSAPSPAMGAPAGSATKSGSPSASANSRSASSSANFGSANSSAKSGAANASGKSGSASASGKSGSASASGKSGSANASGKSGSANASGESGSANASGKSGSANASGKSGSANASGESGSAYASGKSGSANASGVVIVHLPRNRVFGRIWLQRLRPSDGRFHDAIKEGTPVTGDVELVKGGLYRLQLKYDGAEEVSFVDQLSPFIRELNTAEFPITDEQLARMVKGMPNLACLQANRSEITDEGVKCLAPLKKLEFISLSRSDLTAKSLAVFAQMPQLDSLLITHNRLTDASLANLAKLHKLRRLRLNYIGISDAGLAHLEPLTNLVQIQVSGNAGVTDAGIAHLKGLKKLTEIQMSDTAVTYHCLDTLKQLPNLKRITISFRKIGDQGVEIMKKALPASVKISDNVSNVPLEMFEPLHSPIAPQNPDPLR